MCSCLLDHFRMLCGVWKTAIELHDPLSSFAISHNQHMKEPTVALWINRDTQNCNGGWEERISIDKGWLCREFIAHWSFVHVELCPLCKLVNTKKRFPLPQPQRHLSWTALIPPSSCWAVFQMMSSLSQGSSFGSGGRAPSPLSSCPLHCSLPSFPSQGHPTPQAPNSPLSLTPFPLHSLHSVYHLIFWCCLDIYGLSLLFQPFGLKALSKPSFFEDKNKNWKKLFGSQLTIVLLHKSQEKGHWRQQGDRGKNQVHSFKLLIFPHSYFYLHRSSKMA